MYTHCLPIKCQLETPRDISLYLSLSGLGFGFEFGIGLRLRKFHPHLWRWLRYLWATGHLWMKLANYATLGITKACINRLRATNLKDHQDGVSLSKAHTQLSVTAIYSTYVTRSAGGEFMNKTDWRSLGELWQKHAPVGLEEMNLTDYYLDLERKRSCLLCSSSPARHWLPGRQTSQFRRGGWD